MAVDFAAMLKGETFASGVSGGQNVPMARSGQLNSNDMGMDVANMKAPDKPLAEGVAGQSF